MNFQPTGDPGPTSQQTQIQQLQQQQQQHHQQQQQQQFRPPNGPFGGMSPQQVAMFQQMAAARGPNGQPSWNPGQIQAAMQAMASGQPMPGQQFRPPGQQGQPGQPVQPGQMQPGQGQPGQPGQGQQALGMGRPPMRPQFQARPTNSPRPPGMMPPPPPPGQHPQQHPQQQQPPPQQLSLSLEQQAQFTNARRTMLQNPEFQRLAPPQQQHHLQQMQRQLMQQFAMQNGIMGPQGQQGQGQPQMGQGQSPMQQQQQQQQPPPQQSPRPGSAHGSHGGGDRAPSQSPSVSRQSMPPQGQPGQPGQPGQLSSLPQHMAPPRPGSAASQRAGSPHVGSPSMSMGTPPPPPPQATFSTPAPMPPANAPSPAASVHSQHSHHTPGPSMPAASPMSGSHHAPTPTPMQGGPQGPGGYPHHPGTPQRPGSIDPMQQHAQNVQSMLSSGQLQPGGMGMAPHQQQQGHGQGGQSQAQHGLGQGQQAQPPPPAHPGHMGSMPAPPVPMSLQHLSQQQQQQLGSAMNIFNAAAQGRPPPSQAPHPGQPGQPGPPGAGPNGLVPHPGPPPPMPQVDQSDFPFDWRILPQAQMVRNAEWKNLMAQRNPQGLAMAEQAYAAIASGSIRQETLGRMQQLAHWQKGMTGWHQMNSIWMAQNPGAGGAGPGGMPPRPPPPGMVMPGMGGMAGMPMHGQGGQPGMQGMQGMQGMPGMQGQGMPGMAGPQAMQFRPNMPPPGPPGPSRSSIPPSPSVSSQADAHGRPGSSAGAGVPGQAGSTPRADMQPPSYIPGMSNPPAYLQSHDSAPTPTRPAPPPAIPVKDWEEHLHSHIPITEISRLPEESDDPTFGGALPELDEKAQEKMKAYMARDLEYAKGLEAVKEGVKGRMISWAKRSDMETPWWDLRKGERPPVAKGRLTIIWPGDKINQRAKTSHRGRREIRFSPAQLKTMANVQDHIIPVRLDLEHDHHRLRDTFMWNVSDKVVTPEIFAQSMCDDFKVPYAHFGPRIVSAIQERVSEYQNQVLPMSRGGTSGDRLRGVLDEGGEGEGRAIWEVFRAAREAGDDSSEEVRTDEGAEVEEDERVRIWGEDEEVMTVEECMRGWNREMVEGGGGEALEDLRFLVKVDIIVGTQNLTDSFEWDLHSTVTPEEFALSHTRELGLSGEFATALAHDIHEQIHVHKRSLSLVGHTPGSGFIQDDEVRSAFLPTLTESSVLRREDVAMNGYTPIFLTHAPEDLAIIEANREKEAKRKKRGGRARRGIVLPDREPLKTHRSILNPIGPNGLPLGLGAGPAAEEKVVQPVGSSRRAAAIAAQANINLLAQDLPLPQPPSPPAVSATTGNGTGPGGTSRRGKWNRNKDRAESREQSVLLGQNGGGDVGTPSVLGVKRGLREESVAESLASPVPPHKRRSGTASRVGESPTPGPVSGSGMGMDVPMTTVKEEEVGPSMMSSSSFDLDGHAADRRALYAASAQQQREQQQRIIQQQQQQQQQQLQQQRPPAIPQNILNPGASAKNGSNGGSFKSKPASLPSDSSDSDSSDSDDDDFVPASQQQQAQSRHTSNPSAPTPNRTVSASGAVASPVTPLGSFGTLDGPAPGLGKGGLGLGGKGPVVQAAQAAQAPGWTKEVHVACQGKYPLDRFAVVPKRVEGGPTEWRIKCLDCPGKVYTLGPGETFANFEVHLRNKAHIEKRAAARR